MLFRFGMKMYILLFVIGLICGCANLQSIRDFASIASDSAGYSALTDEYATSPERMKKYTLESDEGQREVLTRQGEERKGQVAKLQLFHKAVSSYMSALSLLSADDLVSYDTELKELTDTAVKGNYLSSGEAGAVSKIAGLVARAGTDSYRQKKLNVVIGEANEPLQELLLAMGGLTDAYVGSLENEKLAISAYYRRLIALARDEKQAAYAEELWLKSQAESERVDARIKSAASYRKTIEIISSSHQELFDRRGQVDDKEVQRQVREYANQVRQAYAAARGD